MSGRWALDGRCQAVAHHLEGADLCSNWRNGGRAHDVASRAPWGHKELGLPILLAARRYIHALGFPASGLLRRSQGVARLAASRGSRQPTAGSDCLWNRWRTTAAGTDHSLAIRL